MCEHSMEYIRRTYGVPAAVGRRVVAGGESGVIVGARDAYVLVCLDKHPASIRRSYHPTHEMRYGEMGEVRKPTRSQQRYLDWLAFDGGQTFREYLGIKNRRGVACKTATA